MARGFTVRGRIEAEDRATPTVKKVQKSVGGLSKFLSVGFVAGAAAAGLAVTKLVGFFKDAVTAAGEQELAVKKLDTALGSLGASASGVSERLQAQARALQATTTAGDEAIIAGQALLASFTKNEETIKAATVAALDLSAATGQDLQQSFQLLGRAIGGQVSALTRYGIQVDQSLPKSEQFAAALEKINEQFGGQAQAQAETFAGRLTQVGNAAGDVAEGLGLLLTQAQGSNSALEDLTEILSKLAGILPQVVAETDAQQKALARVFEAETQLTRSEELLAAARERGNGSLKGAFGLYFEHIGVLQTTTEAEDQLRKAQLALADALDEETEAWKRVNVVKLGNLKTDKELIKAARSLGIITREEVNTSLDEQRVALEDLRREKDRLGITDAQLFAAEEKLRDEQDRLTRAFLQSGGSLEIYQKALEETELELESYAGAVNRTVVEQEGLVRQIEAVNVALRVQRAEVEFTSRTFDELRRTIGNTAAVSAALAAGGELVLGGTRINLPGGGSRLVGARGSSSFFGDQELNADGTVRRF